MKVKNYRLANGGKVQYIDQFLDSNDAKKLYNELLKKVPWTHGVYKMFGKSIKTPRLLYAMRDKNIDITSSYTVTGSMSWIASVKKLRDRIEKFTGKKISYAQLNYYRDGNDYIGYHTDSEIFDGDIIASISLGAVRKFVFRHKEYRTKKNIKKREFYLGNGSLIVMNDNAGKHHWKHALPKMRNIEDGRINITFRPR